VDCKKVSLGREQLLDPLASAWSTIPGDQLKMVATPLANQPSEYIKASRDEKKIGKVHTLTVQSVNNGTDIFFRLSWPDESKDAEFKDNNSFPDACGILMPLHGGDPPIEEMGSKQAPVNAWLWKASLGDAARTTIGHGLGTTEFSKQDPISAKAAWRDGTWAVVFARALTVPQLQEECTQLPPGGSVKIGFAVWDGSNGERAGIKSFSKEWRELKVEV
jgi:DMSO reductase family type II enzyme heme b subunit